MGLKIINITSSFPKNFETIKNLKKSEGWEVDRVFNATGINKRYISSSKEDFLNLSIKSAKKILNRNNRKKVGFLIFVSQTSPYRFPSLSCVLQDKLDLPKDIFAIDVNMGCSGYIYAMKIASSLNSLDNKKKFGLIICADTYTKFINKKNKSCRPIFSDASTTTLVKIYKDSKNEKYSFGVDGKGSKDLFLSNNSTNMFMNGPKIAIFTLNEIPNFLEGFMKKFKINRDKVKYFCFHQASKYICNNISRKLRLRNDQIFNNYQKYGNTISSSIPLIFKDLIEKKKVKKNDVIIACGFGVGLSWGVVKFRW